MNKLKKSVALIQFHAVNILGIQLRVWNLCADYFSKH